MKDSLSLITKVAIINFAAFFIAVLVLDQPPKITEVKSLQVPKETLKAESTPAANLQQLAQESVQQAVSKQQNSSNQQTNQQAAPPPANETPQNEPPPQPSTPPPEPQKTDPFAAVSKHNNRNDCWMIIEGHIYNITSYFGSHPGGDGSMLPYCGQDATAAFNSKGQNPPNPHSGSAKTLLAAYLIQ